MKSSKGVEYYKPSIKIKTYVWEDDRNADNVLAVVRPYGNGFLISYAQLSTRTPKSPNIMTHKFVKKEPNKDGVINHYWL
jgi:hypothetical protein